MGFPGNKRTQLRSNMTMLWLVFRPRTITPTSPPAQSLGTRPDACAYLSRFDGAVRVGAPAGDFSVRQTHGVGPAKLRAVLPGAAAFQVYHGDLVGADDDGHGYHAIAICPGHDTVGAHRQLHHSRTLRRVGIAIVDG